MRNSKCPYAFAGRLRAHHKTSQPVPWCPDVKTGADEQMGDCCSDRDGLLMGLLSAQQKQ